MACWLLELSFLWVNWEMLKGETTHGDFTQTLKKERKPDFPLRKKLKGNRGLSYNWTQSVLRAPNYAQGGKSRDRRRLNSEERKILAHLWGTGVKGKKQKNPFHFIICFHLLSWP